MRSLEEGGSGEQAGGGHLEDTNYTQPRTLLTFCNLPSSSLASLSFWRALTTLSMAALASFSEICALILVAEQRRASFDDDDTNASAIAPQVRTTSSSRAVTLQGRRQVCAGGFFGVVRLRQFILQSKDDIFRRSACSRRHPPTIPTARQRVLNKGAICHSSPKD